MRQICRVALGILLAAAPGLVLADNTKPTLKKPGPPPDVSMNPGVIDPGVVRGGPHAPGSQATPQLPRQQANGSTIKVPSTTANASK
jgi:hypothetical protein